jgi:hypothetical protein
VNLAGARDGHSAIRLLDGRVLVVGGNIDNPFRYSEVYDPISKTWSPTSGLSRSRTAGAIAMLADGTVLYTGGYVGSVVATTDADLFDPETNTWIAVEPMAVARWFHESVMLEDGSVLVAGGTDGAFNAIGAAERFDPVLKDWIPADSMDVPRGQFALTALEDGTVLAVGGLIASNSSTTTVERYDFSIDAWTTADSLDVDRRGHAAVRLNDGRVLVVAGYSESLGTDSMTAEIFDPTTSEWSLHIAPVSSRYFALTLLADGNVMVTGGFVGTSSTTPAALIFNPVEAAWFATADMLTNRGDHTATLLADGSVLVAGGSSNNAPTAAAELYPPNQVPVANAPLQSLRVSALQTTTIPVTVAWAVAVDSDPILRYLLKQKTGAGATPFVTIPLGQAYRTSIVRNLNPGIVHQFRLMATDYRGAKSTFVTGAPKKLVAIQDSNTTAITYTGAWTTATNVNMFGGTARYAVAAGRRASVSFTGTNIGWVTRKASYNGKAEVWLDGEKVATVDLFSPTTRQRQMVFVRNGLTPGQHTLEIRVLGTKSAASTGLRVDVDAFVVLQ